MQRRTSTIGTLIFFLPVAFVVFQCRSSDRADDAEANQLLVSLTKIGLPSDAELKAENSEVWNWVGSSTLLQMMAYRVIQTPLPDQQVQDFYDKKFADKALQNEEWHLVAMGKTTVLTPDSIMSIFKNTPTAQQSKTYAIYWISCPTNGDWDFRGW